MAEKDNPKKRPTMMDVAQLAGVSQATVSLVLNGGSGVKFSKNTRTRVEEASRTLGYQFAKRQTQNLSKPPVTIVFIADEISTDPWMAQGFEGARDKALELGIDVCLMLSHGDPDIETNIVNNMRLKDVVGFIYGTILTRKVELPKALQDANTVLTNCYDAQNEKISIIPGDVVGSRMATDYLLRNGHSRVALINGQRGVDNSQNRLRGYKQALASNDIPFDESMVRWGSWEVASGLNHTLELMGQENPPTAIFCANDNMAFGCYKALEKLKLKVPEDVSVVGFDDREIASLLSPALTTFLLPQYEMGELAVQYLVDADAGVNYAQNQTKVECPFIERESVAEKR